MRNWEDAVEDFIARYDKGANFSDNDLEVFIEEGLKPLINEYIDLRIASQSLAENNIQIFGKGITAPNKNMKHSKLYKSLTAVMTLINDEVNLQ